ncbi:hypothetical protein C1646_813604 [Rhizophagus diaphanus]|nr:hypothetical protein C1646_813604 [Rhizophagus diaphanus] [Rhizophagus sp. MUCL 43196]
MSYTLVVVANDEFVSRPQVVERFKIILQPHKIIHETFGKAIDFAFEKVSVTGQWLRKIKSDVDTPKLSECAKALKTFRHASEGYKAKHDKPMVIVYDNVSHLVHKDPEILDILQDDAKHRADDQKYIAVFVCSEGVYLREWNLAVPGHVQKRLWGRIIELKTVADDFLAGQEFKVVKQQVLNKVEKKFRPSELLPNDLYYETEKLNEVLGSNIFSYHPEKNIETFQSQSVKFYIHENADIFSVSGSHIKIIEVN